RGDPGRDVPRPGAQLRGPHRHRRRPHGRDGHPRGLLMPALTAAAPRTQLNSGAAGPLYLLLGDDDAEKAEVAGAFSDLVDPGLQAFNVDRLYGADTSVDALLDVANTFPMMAERRVVLVLEAERL